MRVERRPISSTAPVRSPKRQMSPTRKTSSPRTETPPKRFAMVCLRAEADGQTADAEAGERGAHVESQGAEYRQNSGNENHRLDDAFAEQHERSCAGVSAGEGAIAHAAQRPAHCAPDDPGGADDEGDGRELKVVVPLQQRHAQVRGHDAMDERAREQPRGAGNRAPVGDLDMAAAARPPAHRNFQHAPATAIRRPRPAAIRATAPATATAACRRTDV